MNFIGSVFLLCDPVFFSLGLWSPWFFMPEGTLRDDATETIVDSESNIGLFTSGLVLEGLLKTQSVHGSQITYTFSQVTLLLDSSQTSACLFKRNVHLISVTTRRQLTAGDILINIPFSGRKIPRRRKGCVHICSVCTYSSQYPNETQTK